MLRASLWDVVQEHSGWVVHVKSVPIETLDRHAAAALTRAVGEACLTRREIMVHDACVLLSTQGEGTAVKAVAHVDPQLPYVPRWLVEFVLMAMMPMVYGKLSAEVQRAWQDQGNSEHRRRNQTGAVYRCIRNTLGYHQPMVL